MTNTGHPLAKIPERYEDLTAQWLEAALLSRGTISPETRVAAFKVQPLKLNRARTRSVVRIALEYDSPSSESGKPQTFAGPSALIAKFGGPYWRGQNSVRTLANFQYEDQVYRTLSNQIPLRMPRGYYGAQAPDSDLGVLMIEEIQAPHIRDETGTDRGLTVVEARLALSEIANLHGAWWASQSLRELPWLRSWVYLTGRKRPWGLGARWESIRQPVASVCSPAEISLFEAMLAVISRAFMAVESMPMTLCHGDFHRGNLLWDRLHSPRHVWFLDWEELHRGPIATELAFFLGSCVESEETFSAIDELLADYHSSLSEAGVTNYSLAQLRSDLIPALILTIGRHVRGYADPDPANDARLLETQICFRRDAALADLLGCAEWVRGPA